MSSLGGEPALPLVLSLENEHWVLAKSTHGLLWIPPPPTFFAPSLPSPFPPILPPFKKQGQKQS